MIRDTFDDDACGWRTYDWAKNRSEGGAFPNVKWEAAGGVSDSGHVWTDESLWSIDKPESPHSILALIFYQRWVGHGPQDLRGAEVSVQLRGDALDLKGARCHFWSSVTGSRWHFTSRALQIPEGKWASEPTTFTLTNDESLWHRSWSSIPPKPVSLDRTLGESNSYGFSFVGFSEVATGRLSMDEFEINAASG